MEKAGVAWRHWLRAVAGRGCLIALALLPGDLTLAQTEDGQGVKGNRPTVEGNRPAQAAAEQQSPQQFAFPVRIVEEQEEAERARKREDDSDQRENADLIEQRRGANAATRSADSAERQEDLALSQVILAAFGTFGLLAALWLTYGANKSALRAAAAAEAAVDVARRTAQQQLRAYVLPDSAHIQNIGAGTVPIATVVLKNFGSTPAGKMYGWGQLHIANYPAAFEFAEPTFGDPDGGSISTLGPGSQHNIEIPCGRELGDMDIAAIAAKQAAFWVHGHVDYVDAFGEKRTTDFRLIYGGPSGLSPTGVMVACHEGNAYT